MNIELVRIEEKTGVFGVLIIDEELFCWTVERPDLGNIPNVSCIPEGRYRCKRVNSPKFGETFQVMDVPDRTHILFHSANFVEDLQGCIGLGERIGWIGQRRAVKDSRKAFESFMARLEGQDEYHLTIRKERCASAPAVSN